MALLSWPLSKGADESPSVWMAVWVLQPCGKVNFRIPVKDDAERKGFGAER